MRVGWHGTCRGTEINLVQKKPLHYPFGMVLVS
jgi:hypothetical protein